jgi:hypothetical protein
VHPVYVNEAVITESCRYNHLAISDLKVMPHPKSKVISSGIEQIPLRRKTNRGENFVMMNFIACILRLILLG